MKGFHKIVLIVLFSGILTACTTDEEGPGPKQKGGFAIPVKLGRVVYRNMEDRLRVVGNIQSDQQLTLSPEVNGTLVEIPVEEGMPVKADQLLFRIEPDRYQLEVERLQSEVASAQLEVKKAREGLRPEEQDRLEARLKAAESSRALATKNHQKQLALYKEGIISKSVLDVATDEFKRAEQGVLAATAELSGSRAARQEDIVQLEAQLLQKSKELEMAQLDLERTEVRAPFKGIIISKETELGSYVEAGNAVINMIGTSVMTAVIHLPQSYSNQIANLNSVHIQLKEPKLDLVLEHNLQSIVRVVPFANLQSGSVFVLIRLVNPDPRIAAGQTFEADLKFKERKNVLFVPSIALSISEMGTAVYIVKEGKAHLVPVKAGQEGDNLVEVTDFTHQLNPKVDLVLRGSGAVYPGAQVMASAPASGG